MGKKDKHRPGQSRNNPIFKVVGGKAGKTKNKPQEVNIKLKNVSQLMYLKEFLIVNTITPIIKFAHISYFSDTDHCYPSPCINGGTCYDGKNDYLCVCTRGFEGTNCETSNYYNKII